MSATPELLKVSPSDLTYQWTECKRCFWLKVHGVLPKPWTPFPGIFTKIDGSMKSYFEGMSTEKLGKQLGVKLPEGTVRRGKEFVKSTEVMAHSRGTGFQLSGKLDSRIVFKDGTWGVVDFKTAEITETKAMMYAPQLRSYAYCIEHPAAGEGLRVSMLALLGFNPGKFGIAKDGSYGLNGAGTWAPIDLGREEFEDMMAEVAQVLANPEPGDVGLKCGFCVYRERARNSTY